MSSTPPHDPTKPPDNASQGAVENMVQNELGEVQTCDCGGVNIIWGPVTLHLAADEVAAFHELCTAGLNMISEPPQESRPRRDPGENQVH